MQDADNKKSEKKEVVGPPLQTASVSVRALIEEKIIQKRTTGRSLNLMHGGVSSPGSRVFTFLVAMKNRVGGVSVGRNKTTREKERKREEKRKERGVARQRRCFIENPEKEYAYHNRGEKRINTLFRRAMLRTPNPRMRFR